MAANGISTLANKQLRQIAKLDLAMAKRKGQGITEGSGTWSTDGVDDDTANSYRPNNTYDITALPTNYVANTVNDIVNPDGLLPKRPWVSVGVIAAPTSIEEAVDGGSIPDLQIWYDGADTSTYIPSATDEGQITQWTDKSNFAHNANPDGGAAKPTYENTVLQGGYGYLEFDGNDILSVNPFTQLDEATGWSMFIVANATDISANGGLCATNTGDLKIRIDADGSTSFRSTGDNYAYFGTGTITDNTWHIWSLIYDGTASGNARLIGRLDKTSATLYTGTQPAQLSTGSNTMYLGSTNEAGYDLTGFMGEVIMFNRTLTATEYGNVENYLSNKWDL